MFYRLSSRTEKEHVARLGPHRSNTPCGTAVPHEPPATLLAMPSKAEKAIVEVGLSGSFTAMQSRVCRPRPSQRNLFSVDEIFDCSFRCCATLPLASNDVNEDQA